MAMPETERVRTGISGLDGILSVDRLDLRPAKLLRTYSVESGPNGLRRGASVTKIA